MTAVLWLVLGGALLYFGAEALVRGAVALSLRLGMTPLIIGLTVVAAGTSTPELVVSVMAAVRGSGAIAIGNVVGSNICNILLIAGVAAMIRPMTVERGVVRREIPIMIAASALTVALLLWHSSLLRLEAALLVGLLIAGTYSSIRTARRENAKPEPELGRGGERRGLATSVGLLVAGIALLVIGADRFVLGATELARLLGLSDTVIALSVVAVGTSLPELATSCVAAIRRESDIALGNIVGSNIFNLLGILGIAGLVQPLALPAGAGLDLAVMLVVAVLVLPLARSGFCLHRWEGALLVCGYLTYLVWLLLR